MMERRTLVLFMLILALAALACGPLSSGDEPTAAAGPTPLASPTLAPTATPGAETTPLAPSGAPTLAPTAAPDAGGAAGSAGGQSGQSSGQATAGGGQSGQSGGASGGNGQTAQGGPAACPAGGANLLENPSFEGQYAAFGYQEVNHAPGWFPWWEDDGQVNLRPEYKPADGAKFPNRVHSGSTAQQYFKSYGMFKAGLMQVVPGVPVGSRVQFSVYGQAWSCAEFDDCPGAISVDPANMLMRVGIDPRGGDDWRSTSVKWSAYFNPLDQWQVACIETVAERDTVSVFLWASPDKAKENQDVYWDDASLVVLP